MADADPRRGDLRGRRPLARGADLDADTLIAWSQERLGRHKYPRRVEFFEALPLGPSGKILKRELVKDL